MAERSGSGWRLGVSVTAGSVRAAALDSANSVRETASVQPRAGLPDSLRTALAALPRGSVASCDSVTVATGGLARDLDTADGLGSVAVVRLCHHPEGTIAPPLGGWPADLRAAVGSWWALRSGGHDITGRELGELDLEGVLDFVRRAADAGVRGVAVTATGSPVVADHEVAVAEAIDAALPGLAVTLSHEVGGLSLLARENTAVLNALLRPRAERLAYDCRAAVGKPVLWSRHDAALVTSEYFRRFPLSALGADGAAALRGAGALAGREDAVVCELDGDRARAGLIDAGFPRRVAKHARVRGVVTSLPLPELERDTVATSGEGAGRDPAAAAERVVGRLRGVAAPRPVVLAGDVLDAGRRVADPRAERPDRATYAGAVGAALAQPAAESEFLVVDAVGGNLGAAVERASDRAVAHAISAGAAPDSAAVTDVTTAQVAYLPGSVVRLRVRAAGRLAGAPFRTGDSFLTGDPFLAGDAEGRVG